MSSILSGGPPKDGIPSIDKPVFSTATEVQAWLGLDEPVGAYIDGEDARDFDDAVYAERKRFGGWRLWVAIADVSHYVAVGSALDQEAAKRGNSVYFPGRVVPMLPEALSNGLCSLNPNTDRLALVCEVSISAAGRAGKYVFFEAVFQSHARLTYTKVGQHIEGENVLPRKELHKPLNNLYNVYKALR